MFIVTRPLFCFLSGSDHTSPSNYRYLQLIAVRTVARYIQLLQVLRILGLQIIHFGPGTMSFRNLSVGKKNKSLLWGTATLTH